jgi:A/G-specific adenine glycosylase
VSASAGLLRHALLAWFDRHRRDLPWRRTRDPYAIWVSEVMLQQTQVSTVIPYWEKFLKRFPSVGVLAEASEQDVFAHWRGLGYYSRARNLQRAAQQIVSEHQGRLPRTAEILRTLPGFGRYTAGAVASIAHGEAAAIVDGNVARVFSRWFVVDGAPGDTAREKKLWALAEALVPGERPGDWNQALMELGALVCRTDQPTCLLCPVREHCGALAAGRVNELPPPRVRAARKSLQLAAAVWLRQGNILLGRRQSKGLFGGLWEIPSLDTARSEVCGTPVRVTRKLGDISRTLTHRELTISLFQVTSRGRPSALAPYDALEFFSQQDTERLGISTAMQKAISAAFDAPKDSKKTRGAAKRR